MGRLRVNMRGPFYKMKRIQTIRYLGFYVDLYDNGARKFKYEWKVRPIGTSSLRLTKQNGRYHKVIHDPTSMPRRKAAWTYGKYCVEDLRRPFYFRR